MIFFFCFLFSRFLKKKEQKPTKQTPKDPFVFFCFTVTETLPNPGAAIRPRADGAASEQAATERNELWQWRDVWICLVFGFPLEQRWVWSVLGLASKVVTGELPLGSAVSDFWDFPFFFFFFFIIS